MTGRATRTDEPTARPTTAPGAAGGPAALPGLTMLGGDGPGCVGDACDLPAPEPREH